MRHNPIEIPQANKFARARRIWHGHGCSRVVIDNDCKLPPAEAIDEALAGFEAGAASTTPQTTAHAAHDHIPAKSSLIANLAAQLDALDRQRDQLAQLLRNIDDAAVAK